MPLRPWVSCALSLVAFASPALAQDAGVRCSDDVFCDQNYVRHEPAPTLPGVLSRGARITSRSLQDLNADGTPDAVLQVRAGSGPWARNDEHESTVIAVHLPAGWVARVVSIAISSDHHGIEVAGFMVSNGQIIAVISDQESFDTITDNAYSLTRFDLTRPTGEPVFHAETRDSSETWAFSALADGSVLCAATRDPRTPAGFRHLTWDAGRTALHGSAWFPTRAQAEHAPAVVDPPNCSFNPSASFHLRATDTVASSGPEYRGGSSVVVLAPGAQTRGATRSYRVRIQGDGREGFMFVAPTELPAGCAVR